MTALSENRTTNSPFLQVTGHLFPTLSGPAPALLRVPLCLFDRWPGRKPLDDFGCPVFDVGGRDFLTLLFSRLSHHTTVQLANSRRINQPPPFPAAQRMWMISAHYCFKSFSCNTYESPCTCCKQKTHGLAKLFRVTGSKNSGRK